MKLVRFCPIFFGVCNVTFWTNIFWHAASMSFWGWNFQWSWKRVLRYVHIWCSANQTIVSRLRKVKHRTSKKRSWDRGQTSMYIWARDSIMCSPWGPERQKGGDRRGDHFCQNSTHDRIHLFVACTLTSRPTTFSVKAKPGHHGSTICAILIKSAKSQEYLTQVRYLCLFVQSNAKPCYFRFVDTTSKLKGIYTKNRFIRQIKKISSA